jgi:hypothetical protein
MREGVYVTTARDRSKSGLHPPAPAGWTLPTIVPVGETDGEGRWFTGVTGFAASLWAFLMLAGVRMPRGAGVPEFVLALGLVAAARSLVRRYSPFMNGVARPAKGWLTVEMQLAVTAAGLAAVSIFFPSEPEYAGIGRIALGLGLASGGAGALALGTGLRALRSEGIVVLPRGLAPFGIVQLAVGVLGAILAAAPVFKFGGHTLPLAALVAMGLSLVAAARVAFSPSRGR